MFLLAMASNPIEMASNLIAMKPGQATENEKLRTTPTRIYSLIGPMALLLQCFSAVKPE